MTHKERGKNKTVSMPKLSDSVVVNHPQWQQGQLVEVAITDLSDTGDGVGRWNEQVVFVPDTVPGDRALVRLVHIKPQYAHAKLHKLLTASSHAYPP
jgi:23S rRNA (uracil1939-C5)-methyltransferase